MSEQPTPERVAPQIASRPGLISYIIVGAMLIGFALFVLLQ